MNSPLKTLFVGSEDVKNILTMRECIRVMEHAFRAMAWGETFFPPRQIMPKPDKKGAIAMMPGYLKSPGVLGIKAMTVFPGNLGTPYETHQGVVLIFETANGRLLSAVDAGAVTKIRTAAASAVATDLLSNKDATELAILGSGTQAASHFESMLEVRPAIRGVRIWSRDPKNSASLVKRISMVSRIQAQSFPSVEDTVRGADVICTTTAASTPILRGSWLEPGMHVNAVGASRPPSRELDTEAVARSKFFVDSRESAMIEASDFLTPKSEGAVDDSHIRGEIGEVLEGLVPGRTSPEDITMFKSLGLAIEDLAAAHYVYTQASARGVGTLVEFSSSRHEV